MEEWSRARATLTQRACEKSRHTVLCVKNEHVGMVRVHEQVFLGVLQAPVEMLDVEAIRSSKSLHKCTKKVTEAAHSVGLC